MADGCKHPNWRTDFAANGKLHEFCLTCGAERRSSKPADSEEAARLRNGLRWIRHVAAMNALSPVPEPQQMRTLAVLAEKVLDGADLADYDSSIGAARGKAQEWAYSVGVDIATTDDLQHAARPQADALPDEKDGSDQAQPAPIEAERNRGVRKDDVVSSGDGVP